ncbi:MAG: chromate transporter [Lachnospiraceae bacterium]|nr:chromate transporter [Lachnospiraceae bacterium]MDY2956677.1 chromate transporter [Lachnospiraceae bacterium]
MEKNREDSAINKKRKNVFWELFITFFKIGAFTFGGGYAMIPLIQEETVTKKKWISDEDILDVVAIAESTPGPISLNTSTFVGYRTAGFFGAFCATLGVVLPSFGIIVGISFVLRQFENLEIVKYAFWGIRAGVLALIIKGLISMYKSCPKNVFSYIIMAAAFVAVAFFNINVIYMTIICAVAGIIYSIAVGNTVKNKLK